MRFFDLDSPLMQVLNKVADLLLLNILCMVCCIPIITAGASITALHYMSLKIVRNEECYIMRGFFKSFKENFKQGTIIWLLFLLVVIILAGDFYIMKNSGLEFSKVLQIIITAVGVLVLFTTMFVFPVLAKFDNTTMRTIKNAFVMSILQFPKTVLMVIMWLVPTAVAIFVPRAIPIAFLFGLSAPAFVSALLYNKFFKKLEAQIEEANAQNGDQDGDQGQEDDRIFKDELDPALAAGENQDSK